jgi:hypothetical protein
MKRILGMKETVQSGIQSLMKGRLSTFDRDATAGSRKVIVSSNCQTGGVAAALQVLFPNDEITPVPLPPLSTAEDETRFVEKLKQADVWVSIGGYDLMQKHQLSNRIQLVRIPIIRFAGFHPDLVYARRASTNELLMPHYNSAIAVWAYKNGVEVKDAKRLFNGRAYKELGYLDHWGPSIAELKLRFKDSDLKFSDFMLPMRREGLFMYSLNHPKVLALGRLAKLVALKMGAAPSVLDRHIDINDGLNEIIWPLYPEIAENLSLPGAYEWKMGEGRWINGIEAFLTDAYDNYSGQKIAPQDIVAVQTNEKLFNRVLSAQLGRKT